MKILDSDSSVNKSEKDLLVMANKAANSNLRDVNTLEGIRRFEEKFKKLNDEDMGLFYTLPDGN